MKYLSLLLLAVVALVQQPLPAEIQFEGKQKEVQKWEDTEGKHVLLLTETGVHTIKKLQHENEGEDAEVYAYHYLYDTTTKKYRQMWRVYDYINDCNLDINVGFVPKATTHTDLNNNGIPEIWVVYRLQCTGDVSPPDMKIIMYEGKTKYAVRGTCALVMGEKVEEKSRYEFDTALKTAAPEIKNFARKLWEKHQVYKI
jgi:hypothetical protein